MSGFLLLLSCLLLGRLFAQTRLIPKNAPAAFNAWILNIALPAIVLEQIPRLSFDANLLFPVLMPWMVMAGAATLIPLIGKLFRWERGVVGALVLTCGLGNTAFVGLPMIRALMGAGAMGTAVISDQLGTFVMLSTAGVALAAWYAGTAPRLSDIGRRMLRFPPFLALVLGLAINAAGGWPAAIDQLLQPVLHQLGETLTPLALFSVGLQFRLGALSEYRLPLLLGLSWKLLLAPLIALAIAALAGLSGETMIVGVLQAAMAPMITAGILAQQHHLAPRLASLIVSLGILASLVSVPLFWLLLT